MRLSISNNTSNYISSDVASLPPGGKTIVTVEDDKLEETLAELDKLGSNITYRVLDQSPLSRSVITVPLTLYVAANGDDSNAGTVRDPFRTIQAALDSLKGVEIAADITIQVGAGDFDGFTVEDLDASSTITISGTYTTIESGTTTGGSTADGYRTLVDSTKNWVVNQFSSMMVGIGGNYYPCFGNSPTELYICTGATLTGAYEIVDMGTTISSEVDVYGVGIDGAPSRFVIRRVEFQKGVRAYSGSIRMLNCISSTWSLGLTLYEGTVDIRYSSLLNSSRGVGISNGSAKVGHVSCFYNFFKGCSIGTEITAYVPMLLMGNVYDSCSTVISATRGLIYAAVPQSTSYCKFISCGTGILASQDTRIPLTYFSGTGNTIVFSVSHGAKVQAHASSTVTGTTEISVDGATSTLAAMRALSPKVFPATPNAYGSYVYE